MLLLKLLPCFQHNCESRFTKRILLESFDEIIHDISLLGSWICTMVSQKRLRCSLRGSFSLFWMLKRFMTFKGFTTFDTNYTRNICENFRKILTISFGILLNHYNVVFKRFHANLLHRRTSDHLEIIICSWKTKKC